MGNFDFDTQEVSELVSKWMNFQISDFDLKVALMDLGAFEDEALEFIESERAEMALAQ